MKRFLLITSLLLAPLPTFAHEDNAPWDPEIAEGEFEQNWEDMGLNTALADVGAYACTRASTSQKSTVNAGTKRYNEFQRACVKATGSSKWCQQVARPNPSSYATFVCTYGSAQPHVLIYPNSTVWKYAFKAIQLVRSLEASGVKVAQIYNWWRPEPYNRNVGGAAGRHPYGTSVDVRFSTIKDMERAHALLCRWRAQGHLRALGYYGSTGLHFGIGDHSANTWGKGCPR